MANRRDLALRVLRELPDELLEDFEVQFDAWLASNMPLNPTLPELGQVEIYTHKTSNSVQGME